MGGLIRQTAGLELGAFEAPQMLLPLKSNPSKLSNLLKRTLLKPKLL